MFVGINLGINQLRSSTSMPFTPASLFAANEPGIWLDPSDLTTMFSDRAGTTAVTTPGTVVGLRLDKSKGLTLGADTGTDFSSATGWSLASGISITGGALVFSGVAAGGSAQRTGGTLYTAGVTRVVTIVVTSLSGGTLNINTANAGFTVSAAGTYTARIMGVANNYLAIVAGTGTVTASIDNISVRELAGNHAVAPTDAARPIYGVEPKGGRRNLLTWSEGFDNAAWVKSSVTPLSDGFTITNAAAEPNISQAVTVVSGLVHTHSLQVKYVDAQWFRVFHTGAVARTVWIDVLNGVVGTSTFTSATISDADVDGWRTVTIVTPATSATSLTFYYTLSAFNGASGEVTGTIGARKNQLELGSTATN